MDPIDGGENCTVSSSTPNDQRAQGTLSTGNSNESHDSEFGNDSDDHINGIKSDYKDLSIRSEIPLRKGVFTFGLIPIVWIIVLKFFNISPTASIYLLGLICAETNIPSLLALAANLSDWYMELLNEYPVLTKSLTTGIIQFLGDFSAQRYEQREVNKKSKVYDLRRGLSLFADGLLLSGPLLHYCFEWMEQIWPTGGNEGISKSLATICHVFVNDYIIDSIYIGLSFVFTGIVEGYSLRRVAEIVREDYTATVRASWLTSLGLIPVEILCFGYLSLSLRVLAMNFVDLLWGAIVSFYSHRSRKEDLGRIPQNKKND